VVDTGPDTGPAAPEPEVEVVKKQVVIRDVSPSRYSTTTATTSTTGTETTAPLVLGNREYGEYGPLVARRTRSASRSGGRRELRAEIRLLEAELAARRRGRSRGEVVRAERLSDGQMVVYEERVEKVDEGHRGPRIEKDRKGRMSISVPKYR
jgi:hypothetical protein